MLILVTNRRLCRDDYLTRLDRLAKAGPQAIILREKDLEQQEYELLAQKVLSICEVNNVELIINKNIDAAVKLNIPNIHLSMEDLRNYKNRLRRFKCAGASVHSADEAAEARELGADYLIAGHIFPTDCKAGLPPRGLAFLKEICCRVDIPVFAIGGITGDRVQAVLETGAKGVCIMSEAMTCSRLSCLPFFSGQQTSAVHRHEAFPGKQAAYRWYL